MLEVHIASRRLPWLVVLTLVGCHAGHAHHTTGSGDSGAPAPTSATQGFGQACADSADCTSGLCVQTPNGGLCTTDCSAGCAAGWSCKNAAGSALGVATVCLPDRNNLCLPCTTDAQCNVAGDLCVPVGDGHACGLDCTSSAFPDGYTCTDVSLPDGSTAHQCLPNNGSCACDASSAGRTRGCSVTNSAGTCYGSATCDPAKGWANCDARTPSPEVCDGIDDDCNGLTDDADPNIAYPNADPTDPTCTIGSCTGHYRCRQDSNGNYGWQCDVGHDLTEVCDGKDDNCDGKIDEPFARVGANGDLIYDLTTSNCGGCGIDCSALLTHASAVACVDSAAGPVCQATACNPGYYPSADGRHCLPVISTACQPCNDDSDCVVPGSKCITNIDGGICGQDCSATSLFSGMPTTCTGTTGVQDCCGPGFVCSAYTTGGTTYKQCEPASGTCTCGSGTLNSTRRCALPNPSGGPDCAGVQSCTSNAGVYSWSSCAKDPSIVEVCNGIDDDCNGIIDDGFLNTQGTGTYDTNTNCGRCFNDCTSRWGGETVQTIGYCDITTSPPSCNQRCAAGWVDANNDPSDGCECHFLSSQDPPDTAFGGYPAPGATYVDANCDGIDGVIGDALFVYAGNPNPGDGSMQNPFQTINAALAAWPTAGKKYILVAGGLYQEQLVIDSGVQIHGGYSSDFHSRDIARYQTIVAAPAPTITAGYHRGTVSIECDRWTQPPAATIISGLAIYGYDVNSAAAPGSPGINSYAVYMKDCGSSVQLINDAIFGGRGGVGGNGSDGATGWGAGDTGAAALDGQAGTAGPGTVTNSGDCTATGVQNAGGAGGANNQPSCGNHGIDGGGAFCPHSYNNPDFSAGGLTETHQGDQEGYKSCTQTLPDCCVHTDPSTPPSCTSTPFMCTIPAGATTGTCTPKQTCATTADCPSGFVCTGTTTLYCELPASCATSDDCPAGYDCSAGACTPGAYGFDGAGGYDSCWNVVQHSCNQITESGFPGAIQHQDGLDGAPGANGHSGAAGPGCSQIRGSISGDEWVGDASSAGAGGKGQAGQPGGGGGASAGTSYHDTGAGGDCLRYDIGASGGGGGAGGCGGDGGTAAAPGGGSFGVFVDFTTTPLATNLPVIDSDVIARGYGGTGGTGGTGAYGGSGGNGGTPALMTEWFFTYSSGAGGRGGTGGAGGGGGGGCGGVSYGLALYNTPAASLGANNSFQPLPLTTGGTGGLGGTSPDAAKVGQTGATADAADTVVFCGPGGSCPTGTSCVAPLCQ